MQGSPSTTFACPTCGERFAVDDDVREALLEHGCVFCGASVDEAAFQKR